MVDNQFSNEGLAWASTLVNVGLVSEDDHASLTPGKHDIHSPLVMKEAKVHGPDKRDDDVVFLISYPTISI